MLELSLFSVIVVCILSLCYTAAITLTPIMFFLPSSASLLLCQSPDVGLPPCRATEVHQHLRGVIPQGMVQIRRSLRQRVLAACKSVDFRHRHLNRECCIFSFVRHYGSPVTKTTLYCETQKLAQFSQRPFN